MRKIKFVNGEYYHIYNRGVDGRQIFIKKKDYLKFLRSLRDFNNQSYYEERAQIIRRYGFKELSSFLQRIEKVVEIVAFCLLPNHFHLILRQLTEKGISNFLHKLGTSFTNFFNKEYQRSGRLFQGPYKAIHIDSNEYLLWLSAYVNGNAEIHKIEKVENYEWSSYKIIFREKSDLISVKSEIIFKQFIPPKEYENFVKKVIEESRKRKDMKKYLLESLN